MKAKGKNWYINFLKYQGGRWLALCLLPFAFCLLPFDFPEAQSPVRLAVFDLLGDERGEITKSLRTRAKDSYFDLIDEDLTRVAARGAGYRGSLNLSRDEARALGQSLGCDFYLLGKIQVARRLASGETFYYEALAGLFTVETRTGRLINFTFERARARDEREGYEQLMGLVKRGWEGSMNAISSARKSHLSEIESVTHRPGPAIEVLIDGSEGRGIQQPFFYQRLKPAYTEEAELAGITATVELEAVFGEDGQIGNIEVMRWAGFGLDESAISTVRLLRYKPAELDGKRLTIRGLVRYNFRRPVSQAAQPQAQSQEEIDRLKRSLRDVLRSGQKP
jgi:TonB family protein